MGIQDRSYGILNYATKQVDRFVSPSTRKEVWNTGVRFAKERPVLTSFLTTHLLLSTTPLLLFTTFTLSTLFLATLAAILFVLFWIGLALLILVPTLFVTVGLGCFVWMWGVCWWYACWWVWGLVNGGGEGQLVRVRRKGEAVGLVNGEKGKVEEVEILPGFEDVDCVGLMGGGMELKG